MMDEVGRGLAPAEMMGAKNSTLVGETIGTVASPLRGRLREAVVREITPRFTLIRLVPRHLPP